MKVKEIKEQWEDKEQKQIDWGGAIMPGSLR